MGNHYWGLSPLQRKISAVFALGKVQTADSAAFTQDFFQWGHSLLKYLSALQPFWAGISRENCKSAFKLVCVEWKRADVVTTTCVFT